MCQMSDIPSGSTVSVITASHRAAAMRIYSRAGFAVTKSVPVGGPLWYLHGVSVVYLDMKTS